MAMDSSALDKHERTAIRDYLIQVTLPIIIEQNGQFGIVGTGTLFKIADRRFLVSAAHILDSAPPEDWAFGTAPSGGAIKTFGVAEFYRATDPAADICLVELKDEKAIVDLERAWRFLTLENVWLPDLSSDAVLLCGFPSVKTTFDGGKLIGRLLLVRSKLLDAPPDIGNARPVKKGIDFFIGFESSLNELTGENVSTLDIQGVSGSSLWAYRKRGWDQSTVWSPEHVLKVIGVQSAYVKNNYLRGKSWGVVLALMNNLDAPIKGEARDRMNEMLRLMGYDVPS